MDENNYLMDIKISKADVIWSYVAQFLQLASGILVLPYVLRMLLAEEIGLNYLMLTIGAMVALLDFGFAPQFGRNISYIYGGAQQLKKEGVECIDGAEINYHLLASMIQVAKKVYRILSVVVLVVMLTAGTAYIYYITQGFTSVHNSLLIWVVYSLSTYFQIYFTYYNSLLTGCGKIKESKYAIIASRLTYIVLCIGLIYGGLSLLGLCLANLISPFVARFISYYYYFTKDLRIKLRGENITKDETNKLFGVIWYNAKKLGINFLGAYAINKMGMFIAGLYLTLTEVSSYGLMIQLVTLIGTVSAMFFNTMNPKFAVYRVHNDNDKLISQFACSQFVFYVIFFLGAASLILLGPWALTIIGSNSSLPDLHVLALYCFFVLLEQNHSNFATIIVIGNDVPFVKAAIMAGLAIVLCSFVSLHWMQMGIMGLVLSQGICQLAYNNWKWPKYVLNDFGITYMEFLKRGILQTKTYLIRK